jgi:hypothetical protein
MNNFYALNPDGQATLDEILLFYREHTVYGIDNNTYIYVVDKNGRVIISFESIGYEDDDSTPDVYQACEQHCTITQIQGGIK